MFALLAAAAAGDSGAAVMPWAVGLIADRAVALPAISGDTPGLRWGLLAATVCPVLMAAVLAWLRHESQTTTM
ncbi:MAG TPA: hypothetical protein VK324_10995 [Tepidisphaeraceae bacterium]|nr:hypothetical protein [Tepidisphaeraceae bacterium]